MCILYYILHIIYKLFYKWKIVCIIIDTFKTLQNYFHMLSFYLRSALSSLLVITPDTDSFLVRSSPTSIGRRQRAAHVERINYIRILDPNWIFGDWEISILRIFFENCDCWQVEENFVRVNKIYDQFYK